MSDDANYIDLNLRDYAVVEVLRQSLLGFVEKAHPGESADRQIMIAAAIGLTLAGRFLLEMPEEQDAHIVSDFREMLRKGRGAKLQ